MLRLPLQFHWRPQFFPADLRSFFAHIFAQRAADALLVIATPIALFEFGPRLPFITRFFPGTTEAGLFCVLLFYFCGRLVSLLLAAPLARLFRWFGLAHAMFLGQLARISFLLLFAFIPTFPWIFWAVVLLQGIGTFLYWTGHFTYFASVAKLKYAGEEVSTLEFLTKLALVTAPLAAAFLAVRYGYISVFLTGAALATASAAILLRLPNYAAKLQWQWGDFGRDLQLPAYRKVALGMAGYAWEEIGLNTLWPVFLFITFSRLTTVSYILSGATLFSLLLVYISGVIFDGQRSARIQSMSGFAWGMLWLPRTLLSQFPLALLATEAFDRLLSSVYGTLFSATVLVKSKQSNVFAFYVNREIILSLTLMGGFSLGALLLSIGWNWSLVFLSFLAGALASLGLRRDIEVSAGAKL